MSLDVIQAKDPDLNRVQKSVAKELDALAAALPSKSAPVASVTADYTVQIADAVVLANPPSAATALNVTLPPAGSAKGLRFTVKNTSTAGTVHVRGRYSATKPENIDGAARLDLAAGIAATVYSDGSNWWAI